MKGKRVKAANGSWVTTTNTFRATTAGHITSYGFPICVAEDSVRSNVSTLSTLASIIQTFSADAVLTAHLSYKACFLRAVYKQTVALWIHDYISRVCYEMGINSQNYSDDALK